MTLQTWIAAFLTLCVFSFLYKDNPFYRFAEHLFVGAAAGYLLAVQWQNVLIPNVWTPLLHDHKLVVLIPLALGLMMLARAWDKGAGIARWSLAFYVGIYSGVAIPGYMQAQIFAQLADAAKPFAPGWGAVNSALVLVGLLTVLAYFFFSAPHKGVHGAGARVGIYFLMVAFGASFGYTVMARVSLLIARVQFLLRDWLHVLPGP
ncbi:MAG: hypothetical protein E6K77_09515 [Candidatus Eisenbacteria bacterium]|uniref:Uncharacterized protein n=1 Tax=Eiseniibacteriota bacterium TaxID=2212470 RepID=A0A538SQ54_UNCEI|nr:MAG: hypothetical protein E6K74_09195 [Candidatus Eisenbacteria bacterium]TMQ61720.1 MAG: hypothetical protein E6K77_09515 [Candidatus Eisenbacteria bacterium]